MNGKKVRVLALGLLTNAGLLAGGIANAVVVTPISADLKLYASADWNQLDAVSRTIDEANPGASASLSPRTVNVLAVSESAPVAGAPTPRVQVQGSANATWTSSGSGQVVFSDVGWVTQSIESGEASVRGGQFVSGWRDWSYQFTLDVAAFFDVGWSIGTDSRTTDPFGLQGFLLFVDGTDQLISLDSPVGTGSYSLSAGTHTVSLLNLANIAGGIATRTALMDGVFTWSISGPTSVPEPATLALFSLGLAGIGAIRRKKLTA
jgi:hypothetical protein